MFLDASSTSGLRRLSRDAWDWSTAEIYVDAEEKAHLACSSSARRKLGVVKEEGCRDEARFRRAWTRLRRTNEAWGIRDFVLGLQENAWSA